jgi:hypothetical protein
MFSPVVSAVSRNLIQIVSILAIAGLAIAPAQAPSYKELTVR